MYEKLTKSYNDLFRVSYDIVTTPYNVQVGRTNSSGYKTILRLYLCGVDKINVGKLDLLDIC